MTLRTITAAELIELLSDVDPDARIIVSCDYGDICHTEQALPLRGHVETVTIAESGYSQSGFAIIGDGDDDDLDDDDDDDETTTTPDCSCADPDGLCPDHKSSRKLVDAQTFVVIR